MAVIYFILSAAVLVVAITAVRPPWTDKPTAFRPPWFPVMLTNELAPSLMGLVVLLAVCVSFFGVMGQTIGRLGFLAALASMGLLGWMIALSAGAGRVTDRVLNPLERSRRSVNLRTAMWPNPYRLPDDISVTEGHEYMPGQAIDMYRARGGGKPYAPVLVHVHGGSWSGGNRKQQARPLIHEMASRGWVVLSIDYPLVPKATFPEPIIAIHNALGWVRSRVDEIGADPSKIFLTGGSSGAHLAALAALTDTRSDWTTRRESDPPVAGAVTFYGVFDLLNRHGIRDEWPIVADGLIKADPKKEPLKFREASPIDRVHADAPPFVIIHGFHDSLVPYAESELFAAALEEASDSPVDLVLLRGASHSFDAIPSIRTQKVVASIADHLDRLAGRSA